MNTSPVPPTPERIFKTASAFKESKILLTAAKLGLFTFLGEGERSPKEIKEELGLHERSLLDFLDSLVAMKLLERKGVEADSLYSNTVETGTFLDKNKETYWGGILEMMNDRTFNFYVHLEEALKTGKPQNGEPVFESLCSKPAKLEQFLDAMVGLSKINFMSLTEKFDFTPYKTLCDVGGADGCLSLCVAEKNPHLKCVTLDLPPVTDIAKKKIDQAKLGSQVRAENIDMFTEDFPKVDVITMGNILHDWGLDAKKLLIKKAYEALNEGGVLISIEAMIDDDRRENLTGLLMSVNMLIETEGGFDCTFKQFDEWTKEAGFSSTQKVRLVGSSSAAIAFK